MQVARAAMVDDHVAPHFSLMCALIVDAARRLPNALSGATQRWSSLDWDRGPMSVWHLPALHNKVMRMSFCTPMNQKSKLVYLLSKCVPERCNTRKFGGVALEQFQRSPKTAETLKLLVLTSLLGNYKHSTASSRPNCRIRRKLYAALLDRKQGVAAHKWFLSLVLRCPYLVEFCLRDHICFQMHDCPALERHLASLLPVQHWYTIVEKACVVIRHRMAVLLDMKVGIKQLCRTMSATLLPFHNTLLSICYRMPKTCTDMLSKLTSLRDSTQALKKQVIPVSSLSRSVKQRNDDEQEYRMIEAELSALDIFANDLTPLSYQSNARQSRNAALSSGLAYMLEQEKQNKNVVALWKNTILNEAEQMIGAAKLQQLRRWVHIIGPTRNDALLQLVHLFPLLPGADIRLDAVRRLYLVLQEYRMGCINDVGLPVQMRVIHKMQPLLYDVLQVTVDLIRLFTRVTLVTRLPAHMLAGQFASTQKDLNDELIAQGCGLYDSSEFVWCVVCGNIYSMVSEMDSTWNKVYEHGHRDVVVDYETDKIYCYRNYDNHIGSCQKCSLQRLSLFGVLLQYNRKQYMLCPQPDCGMPMVLDVLHCAHTEHGPACAVCTRKMGCSEAAEWQRLQDLETTVSRCVMCGTELKNADGKYYYGENIYLCTHHHYRGLAAELNLREQAKGEPLTPDEVIAQIVYLHKQRKQARNDRNKHIWKRQLAHSKLMRCSRR